MCCNLALDRVISAKKNKLHHWTAVVLVQCEKYTIQECKVIVYSGEHVTKLHLYRCVSNFMPVQKVTTQKGQTNY